jgi:hypothetical protein
VRDQDRARAGFLIVPFTEEEEWRSSLGSTLGEEELVEQGKASMGGWRTGARSRTQGLHPGQPQVGSSGESP